MLVICGYAVISGLPPKRSTGIEVQSYTTFRISRLFKLEYETLLSTHSVQMPRYFVLGTGNVQGDKNFEIKAFPVVSGQNVAGRLVEIMLRSFVVC